MTSAAVTKDSRHTLSDSLRWTEAPTPGDALAMVEFHALGPLEAMVAGRLANLATPKQRALLVSRIGQPVVVEMILETLSGRGVRRRRR